MTEHTPGPWEYAGRDRNNRNYIRHEQGGEDYSLAVFDTSTSDDDARIMASAPDLLAALEKSEQRIVQLCDIINVLSPRKVRAEDFADQARAAIAKAKGGAS